MFARLPALPFADREGAGWRKRDLPSDAGDGESGANEDRAAARPADDPADLAQYIEPIYRFIYARIGVREDAEDVTSQVFLKAVRGVDAARDAASVRSWLYQTARTSIADFWRERYRDRAQTVRLDPDFARARADDADDEAGGFDIAAPDSAEVGATDPTGERGSGAELTVREILAQLPENYRRVLTLRFLESMPIKAVAEEMQISEGNVKVLQYRALQKASQLGGRWWQ